MNKFSTLDQSNMMPYLTPGSELKATAEAGTRAMQGVRVSPPSCRRSVHRNQEPRTGLSAPPPKQARWKFPLPLRILSTLIRISIELTSGSRIVMNGPRRPSTSQCPRHPSPLIFQSSNSRPRIVFKVINLEFGMTAISITLSHRPTTK